MSKISLPIAEVLPVAERLRERLAPACERIEIAGSIRRKAAVVGDIEMVAIPKRWPDLFERPRESLLDDALARAVTDGVLVRGRCSGDRYKQLIVPLIDGAAVALDLFIVTAETWGVQLAIRTGPKDFSRSLVTPLNENGGRLNIGLRVREGRVWRDAPGGRGIEPVDTPTERAFMELAGGWVEPEKRSVLR